MDSEESIVVAEAADSGLVKQTGREQLLAKLQSLKMERLTARQLEEIKNAGEKCVESFIELSWRDFELDKKQLGDFPETEIAELAEILLEERRRLRSFLKAAIPFLPLPGIGLLASASHWPMSDAQFFSGL